RVADGPRRGDRRAVVAGPGDDPAHPAALALRRLAGDRCDVPRCRGGLAPGPVGAVLPRPGPARRAPGDALGAPGGPGPAGGGGPAAALAVPAYRAPPSRRSGGAGRARGARRALLEPDAPGRRRQEPLGGLPRSRPVPAVRRARRVRADRTAARRRHVDP